MAAGLQVFDAGGNVLIDTSTKLTYLYGVYSQSFNSASQTKFFDFVIPGFELDGSWGWFLDRFYVSTIPSSGKIRIEAPIRRSNGVVANLNGTYNLIVFRS